MEWPGEGSGELEPGDGTCDSGAPSSRRHVHPKPTTTARCSQGVEYVGRKQVGPICHHLQGPTWELESHIHDSGHCRFRGLGIQSGDASTKGEVLAGLVTMSYSCQKASRQESAM